MYKIPDVPFTGVFALPNALADEHLALATGTNLKILIYIYRNFTREISAEEIASALKTDAGEVNDALLYWSRKGLLTDSGAEEKPAPAGETEKKEVPVQPVKPAAPSNKPTRYTYDMICARISESAEVRELFNEAQLKLGRTIGTSDQSSLLLLHDFYGLPVEVILALCEYARSHGKAGSINYIYTVGTDWAKREIDTLELADEEFKRLESLNTVWTAFAARTGIKNSRPTSPQQKFFDIWTREWGFGTDMLVEAYEQMSKHTDSASFPYMNKIIAKWHSDGTKTVEEARRREKEFAEAKEAAAAAGQNRRKKTEGVPKSDASYDMQKAMDNINKTVPALKKREKR